MTVIYDLLPVAYNYYLLRMSYLPILYDCYPL